MFHKVQATLIKALLSAAIMAGVTAPALSADYPNRPVKFVVPSTPGGAIDILARIIAPKLSAKWGQPVVIDNRAGAGGIIGTEAVAKSLADGHTLLLVTTGFVTNQMLYSRVPYTTPGDFTPVTIIGVTPNILVAHPSVGVSSLKELIALGKAKPGTLNFGSSGVGSAGHLQMLLLTQLTGIEMTHIPYSGSGAATSAILSGQTQLLSTAVSAIRNHINNKSVIPLAVMASKRTESQPNVPTITEAGVPDYSSDGWYGLIGPKGMKPDVLDKLYRDVLEVIKMPEVITQLKDACFEPGGMPPADFVKYLHNEVSTWQKVLAKTAPSNIQK